MTSRKVLSIHQPNFLPWIGYFDKINKSDVFIILDNVQLPRGKSIANRNKIKSPQGAIEVVVPLKKPKGYDGKVTYDLVQTGDDKWAKKTLKTIAMNYKKAKYFDRYYPVLEDILYTTSFNQMNISFINFVVKELAINTEIYLLSDLEKENDFGQKNELIANICNYVNANVYLSGHGARKYNDAEFLESRGITLEYQEFESSVYEQLHGDFIPNLSVVDLLMNCGPESKNYL